MRSPRVLCDSSKTIPVQGWRRAAIGVAVALALLVPGGAYAQSFVIDTGAAGTGLPATSLFASGSTGCTPQPECSEAFQYLAARIDLPQAASISGIQLWVRPFSFGGSMDVKIREDVGGLPSTFAPPLFSPNSIYSKRYDNLPDVFGPPSSSTWVSFDDYEAVLAAGTYWITFEPVDGSGLSYSVPSGAPNPLPKYAFFGNDNPGYLALPASATLGVRVAGSFFPGVAFGTATRVAANSTFFGCCNVSDDAIQEGRRDFTYLGMHGPPLTSSYIFHFGEAHVHGRGIVSENGLSAGAYSSTSSAVAAGRGIAYRTYMNMSDEAKTFRVNANLTGAFHQAGGTARGGIYAFDTTMFSDTLLGASTTPGQFLLAADGIDEIGDVNDTIRLDRFFPASALLGVDLETASFPTDTVGTVPMQTGFVTLPAGGTITVLFDVAVGTSHNGSVNFANTLSPAPEFFTDMNDTLVVEIVAVGPASTPAAPVASVAASPVFANLAVGTEHTITATVLTQGNEPVADAEVTFAIASGPNAGTTAQVSTDVNGEAVFTYVGDTLGTDSIQASVGAVQSAAVTATWVAGVPDSVVIDPASATVPVGSSQAFTVEAFDLFGNSLGDVTAASTFHIAPDGSCTGASCSAPTAGPHTVTATYNGKTDQAEVTFTQAAGYTFTGFFSPIDNLPTVNVVKAGRAIPVKFSLNGNHGLDIMAPGYPASQTVACDTGAAQDTIEETVNPGSSVLSYDAANDRYVYVWKTSAAWANSCRQLSVKLDDGSVHEARFRFTK